jgi:hypothetical protein
MKLEAFAFRDGKAGGGINPAAYQNNGPWYTYGFPDVVHLIHSILVLPSPCRRGQTRFAVQTWSDEVVVHPWCSYFGFQDWAVVIMNAIKAMRVRATPICCR